MAQNNKNIKGADELVAKLEEAMLYIKEDAPQVIGVEGVKHFKGSFENEGFTDKSLTKWASRKTKREGGTNSQKILSKSTDLQNSITYRVEGNAVIFSSDLPYAEIHNEGGEITVTPQMRKFFWAKFKEGKDAEGDSYDAETSDCNMWKAMALSQKIVMPARPFMKDSEELMNKINNKITKDLTRILN